MPVTIKAANGSSPDEVGRGVFVNPRTGVYYALAKHKKDVYIPADDPQDLYVNGLGSEYREWDEIGASPFLDAQDQPTNYIETKTDGQEEGKFDFQDTVSDKDPSTATLYVYCKSERASDTITCVMSVEGLPEISTKTIDPDATWGWKSVSLGAFYSTKARIDAAQMILKYNKIGGGGPAFMQVDAAYIHVTYIAGWTYERELRLYRSIDGGLTWENYDVVDDIGDNNYEHNAFSMYYYDDGAKLWIVFAWCNTEDNSLRFIKGYITDGNPSIAGNLDSEQICYTPASGTVDQTCIAVANDGYIWILFREEIASLQWKLKCAASNAVVTGTPSSWTVQLIKDPEYQYGYIWGTLAPLNATHDMLIVYVWMNKDLPSPYPFFLVGKEISWNGSTFDLGGDEDSVNISDSSLLPVRDIIGLRIDSNNYGHCIYTAKVYRLRHRKWTVGAGGVNWSGYTEIKYISPNSFRSFNIGIDKTASPNKLIAFYSYQTAAGDIYYQTSPADTISWTGETKIDDDSIEVYAINTSIRDYQQKVQIIYRASAPVRFAEADLSEAAIGITFQDGFVCVN